MRNLLIAGMLMLAGATPACAYTDGGAPLNLQIPSLGDSGSAWSASILYDLRKISTAAVVNSTVSYSFLNTIAVQNITGISTGAAGIRISSATTFTSSVTIGNLAAATITSSVTMQGDVLISSAALRIVGNSGNGRIILAPGGDSGGSVEFHHAGGTANGRSWKITPNDGTDVGRGGFSFLAGAALGDSPTLKRVMLLRDGGVEISSGPLILNGTGAYATFNSSVNASAFFGYGGNLTGVGEANTYGHGGGTKTFNSTVQISSAVITYVQASSITTTGGTGINIKAASGVGTSGQGFLDLTNAGYGPTSGTTQWLGNVGNVLAYWASGTHRFYVNATGSGVMEITAPGVIIGAGTAIAKVQKVATASTDLGAAITATCTAETNFSITGVAVGDSCTVTTPAAIAASDWVVCRTLLDNVALKYCTQGAAVDPAAMVYHITTIEY